MTKQPKTLLKSASDVAALIKAVVQMSDDVVKHQSPLDMQGKLLRLHNSIQKNRPRVVVLIDELCDLIEAEGKIQ